MSSKSQDYRNYEKALHILSNQFHVPEYDLSFIRQYVEYLEKFKSTIEETQLLSKKYRVIAPYSNYPLEPTIQFYYSDSKFNEYSFSKRELKKIPYDAILNLYMKDPEYYNWVGHDYNWVCTEGGEGYAERTFNETKFDNMIQHSLIVSDYIKSDSSIKLSLINS